MADDELKEVGDRIREARLLRNWRQRELADAVGVSTQAINRYETGARNVYADKLMAIARALDVPVGQLFPNGDGLTPDERSMLDYLRSHPSHKRVVQSTLRGLREVGDLQYEGE